MSAAASELRAFEAFAVDVGAKMADAIFARRKGAIVEIHVARADLAAMLGAAYLAGAEMAIKTFSEALVTSRGGS